MDDGNDIGRFIAAMTFLVYFGFGAFSGLEYLGKEYRTHLQRMETDSRYKAQIFYEKEQEKQELNKLGQEFAEGWRDKHKIPGLEYVLTHSWLSNSEPASK